MDQQVTKINIDNPTILFGLKVRTCNMNEMSGEGAKIAGLWQQFYTDIAPHRAKFMACTLIMNLMSQGSLMCLRVLICKSRHQR